MKFFEIPEINVKSFDRARILTASDPAANKTAVEQALAEADKIDSTAGTFIVDI